MRDETIDTTELLKRWRDGETQAFEALIERVYGELKNLAHRKLLDEFRSSGLRTTELLNEACILLIGKRDLDWKSRKHFLHTAGLAMYRFLVDFSRKKKTLANGGHVKIVTLSEEIGEWSMEPEKILVLEQALSELQKEDPLLVQIVQLRFFAGYSIKETAEILEIPTITTNRKWSFAKALLSLQLRESALETNEDEKPHVPE